MSSPKSVATCFYRAAHEFHGDARAGQLSFDSGDVILVQVGVEEQNGWVWALLPNKKGSLRKGWCPVSYIEAEDIATSTYESKRSASRRVSENKPTQTQKTTSGMSTDIEEDKGFDGPIMGGPETSWSVTTVKKVTGRSVFSDARSPPQVNNEDHDTSLETTTSPDASSIGKEKKKRFFKGLGKRMKRVGHSAGTRAGKIGSAVKNSPSKAQKRIQDAREKREAKNYDPTIPVVNIEERQPSGVQARY